MSAKYSVQPPNGSPGWCKVLTQSITLCLKDLFDELRENSGSVQKIDKKVDKLSEQILADVEKANIMAKEALEIAKDVKQDMNELNKKCQKIEHDNYLLKLQCNGLQHENSRLQKQQDSQESYSKRDNLLIHGIVDDGSDDDNTCSRLTRDFFVQNLNISKHDADKIVFVRCHRVGKKSPTVKRPMIVRFQCYADRQLVWNTRFHLKNKAFSLHENFASGVEYRRKLLYPIMSKARKSDKYQRIYLNGDILKINGRDYTVDDLGVLPKDLHPNNFAVKENDNWIIFGGIHSPYMFLSNYYETPITYNNIVFADVERAFQYVKAKTFKDTNSAEKILCSTSPSVAKHIGSTVKNFNMNEWSRVRDDVMLQLLRIKFAQGSDLAQKLLATSGKSLEEAGKSDSYSIGMTLHDKELFNTAKWTKNVLGQLLMKVREELV